MTAVAEPPKVTSPTVSVNTKALKAALASVQGVVNSRSTVPILGHVLLEAKLCVMTLRATDLDVTIEETLLCEIDGDGTFATTVNPRLLERSLMGTTTNLRLLAEESKLEAGSALLPTLPADEFPPKPVVGDCAGGAACKLGDLVTAVKRCSQSAKEEHRGAVMTGTLLEISPQEMRFVSTDGYRLGDFYVKPTDYSSGPADHAILPNGFVAALRRLKVPKADADREVAIDLYRCEERLNVVFDNISGTRIYARCVDGQYPNYRQVIPSDYTTAVHLDGPATAQAVKAALTFALDSKSSVRLTLLEAGLMIRTSSDSAGAFELTIPYSGGSRRSGPEITALLNGKFVIEALSTSFKNTPTVPLAMVGALSPVRFGVPNEQVVVMPLRT